MTGRLGKTWTRLSGDEASPVANTTLVFRALELGPSSALRALLFQIPGVGGDIGPGGSDSNIVTSTLYLVPCAILMHRDPYTGLWLAISRGADLSDWGFPGGKVEDGESPIQAALREFWEETRGGEAFDLVPIYSDDVPSGRRCYAFASAHVRLPDVLPSTREGTVAWRPEVDLIAPTSTYAVYNRAAFAAYHARFPWTCFEHSR